MWQVFDIVCFSGQLRVHDKRTTMAWLRCKFKSRLSFLRSLLKLVNLMIFIKYSICSTLLFATLEIGWIMILVNWLCHTKCILDLYFIFKMKMLTLLLPSEQFWFFSFTLPFPGASCIYSTTDKPPEGEEHCVTLDGNKETELAVSWYKKSCWPHCMCGVRRVASTSSSYRVSSCLLSLLCRSMYHCVIMSSVTFLLQYSFIGFCHVFSHFCLYYAEFYFI